MPLLHVVLIEWAPGTTAGQRDRARTIARSFPQRIPGVVSVVEGPSVSTEQLEGPHDYGMVITFTDAAARDAYLPHPVHQEFVALLQDGAAGLVTVFDIGAQ